MKKLDRKQAQQLVVLGVLLLTAIGYAAYQILFTGSTGASTKSTTTTASDGQQAKGGEQQQEAIPEWLTSSEPARDPFVIPPQFDNLKQSQIQNSRPVSTRVAPAPNVSALPPMPVMPVSGGANSAAPPAGNQPAPAAGAASEPEPNITVTGVVVGDRPVAILRSEGNNQRIVQPGSQLEGGYVLRAVSREGIVLEKDGKTVNLRPGGNPNAK
ncbi:MAG: type II secretion system protein N [Armatimonadota bacterium]|nr:hypothetical protein [bacterium]MDW8321040.1 type II secretion system protein N [Armatimonadota bacterium]